MGNKVAGGYDKLRQGVIPSGQGLNYVKDVIVKVEGMPDQKGLHVLAVSAAGSSEYPNMITEVKGNKEKTLFVSPSTKSKGWCHSFNDPSRRGLCVANIGNGLGWRIVGFFTASLVWLTHGEVSRMMIRIVFVSEGSMTRLEDVDSVWRSLNFIDVNPPVQEEPNAFPVYTLGKGGGTERLARSMMYVCEDAVRYGKEVLHPFYLTGSAEKARRSTQKNNQANKFKRDFYAPVKAPRQPANVTVH